MYVTHVRVCPREKGEVDVLLRIAVPDHLTQCSHVGCDVRVAKHDALRVVGKWGDWARY